jgi:hypothetical protein
MRGSSMVLDGWWIPAEEFMDEPREACRSAARARRRGNTGEDQAQIDAGAGGRLDQAELAAGDQRQAATIS